MSVSPSAVESNKLSKPVIFLLSLSKESFWDDMYSNLVDAMAAKATIKRGTKPQSALTFLTNNRPSAVLITDPAIVSKKSSFTAINDQIVAYVRNGGTAVLATTFSSFVRSDDLTTWFRERWGLPWKSGDYQRTTVHLNPRCNVPHLEGAGLPKTYSQKAVFLDEVAEEAAVYLPGETSRVESMVFAAEPVDRTQSPVVFARVGEGWLGYVGDVNNETESQEAVLAMCALVG